MANEDEPKQDCSKGLDAGATSGPDQEKSNDYGKNPLLRSVIVPCKNERCAGAVESGFVFNVEEWIAIFISMERECPICHSKAIYSRGDVEVFF
jgi:hypothetical protein